VHNEEYIASGILELYAAGGLTPPEREEVEHRAATSPEIRLALDEACAVMESYASRYAISPRTELKDRIMQQIANPQKSEGTIISGEEIPVYTLPYPKECNEGSAYKWMMAASIVLFLFSGWLSFHFYTKWQEAEQRLAGVIGSEQLMANNYRSTSFQLQQQETLLSILQNPDFKVIALQGVEAHPEAKMKVYWNAMQQQVYVDQGELPTPPAGKQYQLWALKDGKPIDAGMIEVSDGKAGLQQMKNISSAQTFAVTLEPAGGSKKPTLEKLTVLGNV
jgi:anti-sigma-K factor RskA